MPRTNQPAFRPARAEDKSRVLEITAHTWGPGEGDYIAEVWDRWLADPQGEFTVAELDGAVVALAKLTWVADGEWWMEGLRVDPEHRRAGIGQAMNTYQVQLARKLGGRVVRYATGLRNAGSHRIAERADFHVLTRFVERTGEKLDEPAHGLETLIPADLDAAWQMASESDSLQATRGVYVWMWRARALTRERLAEHVERGHAMGMRDATGRLSAWALAEIDPAWDRMGVTTLVGSPEDMTTLGRALRAHAGTLGKIAVELMVYPLPRALDAIAAAGYQLETDRENPGEVIEHGIDVLELRLDQA
jgi:GNAT superfamily N-acetyltransferase